MSRTNALALAFLMTLSACSTASSPPPRKPEWTTTQCPPAPVTVDRSFAAAFPPCVDTILTPAVKAGSWGELAIDLTTEVKLRNICLAEVAKWRDAEQRARTNGAPGT
jgi:hypothetical protein